MKQLKTNSQQNHVFWFEKVWSTHTSFMVERVRRQHERAFFCTNKSEQVLGENLYTI